MNKISIAVDTALHSAYIRLGEAQIDRTVEYNDQILIDLDAFGIAVGIEVLDDSAALPFTELTDRFHVHTAVVETLRLIRPSVAGFVSFSQGTDGSSSAHAPRPLAASA